MISNEIEKEYGFSAIGIDEAGRGPLAGAVVASAVLYNDNLPKEINDSKKLSEAKREKLYDIIMKNAKVGIGIVSAEEIDNINILRATELAMQRAYSELGVSASIALIDGNIAFNLGENQKVLPIVKGDSKSISIAAASIIAKVTRDRMLLQLHEQYPHYAFDKHKGYPTALHMQMLNKYGAIKGVHRHSFAPVKLLKNQFELIL